MRCLLHRRTGRHEAIAAKWIEQLDWVNNFIVLPKTGKNAVKVTSDGNIESETETRKIPGKSLDFKWKTFKTTFYAMHKYTKEGGGNQESQYKEMLELMDRFLKCRRHKNIALIVIVDGGYYQQTGKKRLLELKSHEKRQKPFSYAMTIGDLPNVLMRHDEEN